MIIKILCLLVWLLAVPIQSHAASTSTGVTHSITNGKTWSQQTTVQRIQTVCILLVLPIVFVADYVHRGWL